MSDQHSKTSEKGSQGNLEESYPLSPLQHGMLFHNLFERAAGVDIEQIVCTLDEELDYQLMAKAWEQVVSRNAILRTAFEWEGLPEPVQNVHRTIAVPLETSDWRGLSSEAQRIKLDAFLKEDRRKGIDLTKAPLLRVAVFRTADSANTLVWTFHHALLDGRSYRLVIREVFEFYAAMLKGLDPELKQPRPYRDYIAWTQEQDLGKAEAFWRRQLGDFTVPTPLVVDRKVASDLATISGPRLHEMKLTMQITSKLRELAESNELTLNTLVQGAWALLLSFYSGEEDVVFGVTRACRHSSLEGLQSMLGLFINTIPMRINAARDRSVLELLHAVREQHLDLREYENTPLVKIQEWSGVGPGKPLFESILVYDNDGLNSGMRALGGNWDRREFRAIEQTSYPLTLFACGEPELLLKLAYDESRFEEQSVVRMAGHLGKLLIAIAEKPTELVSELCLLTVAERRQMLSDWNKTGAEYPKDAFIHELFEDQVARSPEAVALVFENREMTYTEVNQRANQLAAKLRMLGVCPDRLVGISVRRSPEMVIGLLAILKSGGAYVPLDPDYPAERLEFMIGDANIDVLLTQRELSNRFAGPGISVINLDDFWAQFEYENEDNVEFPMSSANLAYVIYTSGSTGAPKGVMVEHRNVVNFFKAIDDRFGTEAGVWLAVTSISFDISVLELLWTLTRGFKVVIQGGSSLETYSTNEPSIEKPMDFSLFYFASDQGENNDDKYRLLLDGARFADTHNFAAVWTPERHFHPFGGLYPNPSVTSAAIAATTQNLRIRAGSVVLPLHDPLRVAEEWAVVDNISKGRVDVSFASGWHASDFALSPESYSDRKEVMLRGIETVRRLWRGESIPRTSGDGSEVQVRIFPKPLQNEIPIWLTAAGSPDTFRAAGEVGANLLTNLLGQSIEELAQKIKTYRTAFENSNHNFPDGKVTLMLHTFVSDDLEFVREKVRKPFTEYLKTSVNLIKNAPWAFPAFRQGSRDKAKNLSESLDKDLAETDLDILADYAFERYFETNGLFGTPGTCLAMVNSLKEIGVDEIACLVDFNVDTDSVLAGLEHLDKLRELSNSSEQNYSIAAQIARHKVTHMQCTPSAARLMIADNRTLTALKSVDHLVLGGEAIPSNLVHEISGATSATIYNMYGPTETTIWSTACTLTGFEETVPIGRPLANTQVYILNNELQPVPIGIPGELYIGGDGVTRGYLGQPQLSDERFITSPFSNGSAARLYRTGDLAAFQPDGSIDFLGRMDHQVKIRGYRIELGEIQTILDNHPSIRQSVVHAREDVSEGKSLVAYVVPNESRLENRTSSDKDQLGENLGRKSGLNGTFERPGKEFQSTNSFSGGNYSFDGRPISEAEISEGLKGTVSKILALKPSKVLEIGCGTGLLLSRIAPFCSEYCATDISQEALNQVQRTIDGLDLGLPPVTLLERSADDFTGMSEGFYDTIILNSFVKYFPDLDYALKVIRAALQLVKPGGSIFIGDVRSLPLLEAYHTSVELMKASGEETCSSILNRIEECIKHEKGPVCGPGFFESLREAFTQIGEVEITLKKGRHHNQVTKFRYDVNLKVGLEDRNAIQTDWIEWSERVHTIQDIRELLKNSKDDIVAIAGIPNIQLLSEFALLGKLKSAGSTKTVSELRQEVFESDTPGLDPADIWGLGEEFGFTSTVRLSFSGPDWFDVVFFRREMPETDMTPNSPSVQNARSIAEYSNQAFNGSTAELSSELRDFLKAKIPDYMVPSAFVVLDQIPLTPNGKVDRAALPAPGSSHLAGNEAFLLPATELEEVVAELWAEMLGINKVGTNQSFFHVGGHSLLATQLLARLRRVFQVDLSLREIFDYPTVSGIVSCLVRLETQPGQSAKIARIMKQLNQMPNPESDVALFQNGQST